MNLITFNDLPEAVREIGFRLSRVEDLLREKQNPPTREFTKIYTLPEAATYCRMPIPTFRLHLTKRNVSGSKPSKRWVFYQDDLDKFLKKFHHKTNDEIRLQVDQTIRSRRRRVPNEATT
jgi:hypothetical protein